MTTSKATTPTTADRRHRGLLLPFKLMIGEKAYRVLTRPAAAVLRMVPASVKYSMGLRSRRAAYPYSLIREGDTVIQVGAPRDLLAVGRSRTVYYLNLVGPTGKVVVFEPDPDSATALRAFAKANGLAPRLDLIQKGAWSKEETLSFLSSDDHPAANLVQGVLDISDTDQERRQYKTITIAANSIDAELGARDLLPPRLISITANGSETEIIRGMKATIKKAAPYISLAITGEGYPEMMAEHGYKLLANDDRGFTFAKA